MKKLRYEKVYDAIKDRIKNGIYLPGEKLPRLEDLSKEFGVSISSVREAVRIFNKQKILTVRQGSGTFVRDDLSNTPAEQIDFLENASFNQLAEARLIIEPELAALAAEKATEDEVKKLLSLAEQMKFKADAGKDFLKEDLDFHFLIADICKNEILSQMIYVISDLLIDSRRKTMKWEGMDQKASAFHILIAQAIAQKNPTQARDLMRSHLSDIV